MENGRSFIPDDIRKGIQRGKDHAYTLYVDFVIDATASMSSLYPAVYYGITHIIEGLNKHDVNPMMGITFIRNEKEDESIETEIFEDGNAFTDKNEVLLRKVKNVKLYGGGDDGAESIHTAIGVSMKKFPFEGRNKAVLIFTDAYKSNDYCEYIGTPVGRVVFFSPSELWEEDFRFSFMDENGEIKDVGSPCFVDIRKLFNPLKGELLDNIVKPLKDLIKGVSIGA